MSDLDEDGKVATILEVLGDLDPEVARRFLRQHNGNAENALNALLNENTGEAVSGLGLDTGPPPLIVPPSSPRLRSRSLENVGQEEDQLKEAIRMSLENSPGVGPSKERSPSPLKLRPSDRQPNDNWAMTVPSQAPAGISQEDEMMQRAVQASMASLHHDDFKPKTAFDRMRTDDKLMAFRAEDPSLQWAAMVLQVICALPHVRRALAEWGKDLRPDILEIPYTDDPYQTAFLILLMCVRMKQSNVQEYIVDDLLAKLPVNPLVPGVPPGDVSQELYGKLTNSIELLLLKCSDRPDKLRRIFALRHGSARVPLPPPEDDAVFDPALDTTFVNVTVTSDRNDGSELLAELEKLMTETADGARVISAASDVIAFSLTRMEILPPYSSATTAGANADRSQERRPFKYPAHLYLDQFLRENYEKTHQLREERRATLQRVAELEDRKYKLTHHKGKDVLKDLRGSLYYMDNVADRSDATRVAVVEQSAEKLRNIIAHIKSEISSIDQEVVTLKEGAANALLGGADMQKHRYDLRAILVHDGQVGRKHLISYVRIGNKYFRTVDDEVTELDSLPLNDGTGLHYNAGPYMLIYSRAPADEYDYADEDESLMWPDVLRDLVERENQALWEQASGQVPSSPPTKYATPSSMEVNASPAGEPDETLERMDTS
ncbi:hypothetical protein PENSPDRAFT_738189 [Peniophora sp. CONT]|nr:hypothetical protein PENSPDRAFT_738189 [Peniophora sp. CONT]